MTERCPGCGHFVPKRELTAYGRCEDCETKDLKPGENHASVIIVPKRTPNSSGQRAKTRQKLREEI